MLVWLLVVVDLLLGYRIARFEFVYLAMGSVLLGKVVSFCVLWNCLWLSCLVFARSSYFRVLFVFGFWVYLCLASSLGD